MMNPAWKPARRETSSLGRLADQLLGEAPETATGTGKGDDGRSRRLPVLVALERQPDRTEVRYFLDALARQLELHNQAADARHAWTLESSRETTNLPRNAWGLLLVEASLPGIRHAYARIKHWPERPESLGVLMVGARDRFAARRCYRRLAVGTLRFLDLPLAHLGELPTPGPDFSQALARLASLVHSQPQGTRPQRLFRKSDPQ
ncbi:hypothetical protein [Thiohalobacter sp.]|uniref:hypothetical protein n=1 Tax=Thiohalobacter sp. TaxID=2025948 RepID=UPI00260CBF23|nr:hypothetical protein [Thiohalobacter sp.]